MTRPVDVAGLLALWTEPLPADDLAARAAFARFYTDPVSVNGADVSVAAMVERARALQAAFTDRRNTILDAVTTADRLVVAFELRVRHVGALRTPLGEVAATGREVVTRAIDVLVLTADGRISAAHVVSDELGLLTQLDAVRLA